MGKAWARLRWFEVCVALVGGAAFAVVGPLRGAFAVLPEVLLVGTLVLFMVPGVLLTRWFLSEYFSGVAALPAAFVISAGAFALLGVPMLLLQSTLEAYLWASGTAVAGSLLAAALVALRPGQPARRDPAAFDRGGLLWLPFLALVAELAYISRINAPSSFGDIWVYLSWVREFLGGDQLASEEPYFGGQVGLSRVRINGWLLEQAAFSRVSGVDPVDLVFSYLNPALVVVALLAFYALARTLLGSEKAALFCGCLYALFLLVHLHVSRLTFGGEFIQRLPEDKLATKFLFLPLALAFAAAFLEGGRRVYLWCFAFVCCAVMAVHPIGLAIIGVSMAGFGTLHLAANPRARERWGRISAMGLAGLVVIAVSAILILEVAGKPLTAVLTDSDINSGDPDVLRNMIFVSPERQRIFEFADGSYMMHPSLVLNPVILTAFVTGTPFLLWRVRGSLAAQLLLGALILTTVVCYVPPIATFLGDELVLPGQLWRLAWPIPLAALLTLGWFAWEVSSLAAAGMERLRLARPLARALPLLLVVALTVAAVPWVKAGLEPVERHKEVSRAQGFYPVDPIYPWIRDEIASPSVVLASDLYSARIPSYSSEANVVSRRGSLILRVLPKLKKRVDNQIEVPQGSLDVREFFNGTDLETGAKILRRHEVDYVMVRSNSELDKAMDGLPGFEPVGEPSKRFDLYEVDLPIPGRLLDTPGNARLPPQ
ncbi:MAG: DUF6077 domain-containing protein [Actinomycetota bacterium]|nr:DUF6077 domain-containing protein [Actinomycetota bacterium]